MSKYFNKLVQQLKDINFEHAYIKLHDYEMLRRKTRKNLLILSMLYGGLIVFIGCKIF